MTDLWPSYQAAHRAYLSAATEANRTTLIRAFRAWCIWFDPASAERNVAQLIANLRMRKAAA